MPKLRAIKDTVIVKRDLKQEMDGHVYVPCKSQVRQAVGTVISVGNDPKLRDIKVGDKIIFDAVRSKVIVDGEDFHFLKEDYILGIVEGEGDIRVWMPDLKENMKYEEK